MTKLVLVVGFLGAGKTTMMKEILNEYKDQKIGVIVNEFGEVNIDSKLIDSEGLQMSQLSNGSIFCACIKDKFVDSLIEMSGHNLDYLFIEASGLADPANMSQILEGIKPKTISPYDYKGALCIIDGENFLDLFEVLPAISSQLEFSMAVIINKGDLIDEETLGKITTTITEINPACSTFVTSFCKVNTKEIIEELTISITKDRDSVNTVESRPTTFVVKGTKEIPQDKLIDFVKEIADKTYRIKGFAMTDKGNIEISAVGEHINISPWEDPVEKTELMVISSVGFTLISGITKAIDNNVKDYLRI